MRILITGVGGPTPVSVAISLKRFSRFRDCWILGVDANPLGTGLYRTDLFNKTCVVPTATSESYWPAIELLVERNDIDLALVQPEVEVVEWSRRPMDVDLPCKVLLPAHKLAKLLVDKSAMTQVLGESGLVPHSVSLNRDLACVADVEARLPYPFWIRASSGSSGIGSLLVTDSESLSSWVKINKGVDSFLCSEYLPGRNLACKLLYFNGQLVRTACAERVRYIMAKVAPSGVTGNTAFGRFLNDSEPVDVSVTAMDRLFAASGADKHGFFTVDLKEDALGNPKITEVNVRNVAFSGCFSQLGANFSEDVVRLLTNDPEFDASYHQYQFDDDYVFIRDVDVEPKVLRQSELLTEDGHE